MSSHLTSSSVNISDFDFVYPERLIATERQPPSRVMWVQGGEPKELSGIEELLSFVEAGDLLVLNDTRVLRRRIFTSENLEILFLNPLDDTAMRWRALCPSSRWKNGVDQVLPNGVRLRLEERGRTQIVSASEPLTEAYFEKHGEMPLPPYIQKARGERHNRVADTDQYQTAWSRVDGSLASPTASLHLRQADLDQLLARGVQVKLVTLHVGLGTFLPITAEKLDDHIMHAEVASVPAASWQAVLSTRAKGKRVWALGTTVARTLEAVAHGQLPGSVDKGFAGETALFIRPGHEWKAVDVLLTNFHQPRSTLLALVSAFAGLDVVKRSYAWAVEREFRLFSYGDLTAWMR